jgi:hypothetical protein
MTRPIRIGVDADQAASLDRLIHVNPAMRDGSKGERRAAAIAGSPD